MDFSDNFKKFVKPQTEEEKLASSSFNELYRQRVESKTDPEKQNELAPYEHRALVREFVKEKGIVGAAAMAIAIPPYTLSKVTGIEAKAKELGILDYGDKTWAASTNYGEEIKQGYIGLGEGMAELMKRGARTVSGAIITTRKTLSNGSLSIGEGLGNLFKPPKASGGAPRASLPSNLAYNIDHLMDKLIFTESRGVHREPDGTLRISEAGAKGITQLMPKTAKNPGYGIAPVSDDTPEEYIRFGKEYLTKMIQIFGDVEQGVAAYNAGPGNIHRAISKAARTGRDWKEFIPQETKDYIKKVR